MQIMINQNKYVLELNPKCSSKKLRIPVPIQNTINAKRPENTNPIIVAIVPLISQPTKAINKNTQTGIVKNQKIIFHILLYSF